MMESSFVWQTGEPKKEGNYIVSLSGGVVAFDELYGYECIKDSEVHIEYTWRHNFPDTVIAWCKLSDVKPYIK